MANQPFRSTTTSIGVLEQLMGNLLVVKFIETAGWTVVVTTIAPAEPLQRLIQTVFYHR